MNQLLKKPWFVGLLGLVAAYSLYSNLIAPLVKKKPAVVNVYSDSDQDEEAVESIPNSVALMNAPMKKELRVNNADSVLKLWFRAPDSLSFLKDPFKSLEMERLYAKSGKKFREEKRKVHIRQRKRVASQMKKSNSSLPEMNWRGVVEGPKGNFLLKNQTTFAQGDSLKGGVFVGIQGDTLLVEKNLQQQKWLLKR